MKKTLDNLLIIASIGLVIGSIIFLGLFFFKSQKSEWLLPAGLFCFVLSNLFNLIRTRFKN